MSEQALIDKNAGNMMSAASLRLQLSDLGIKHGDCVFAHTSLSQIGWLPNGAQLMAEILVEAVGDTGLICVPTFTGQNTDPANWSRPPVPHAWHAEIRNSMPAFQPEFTPSRMMGAINEVLRTMPEAYRGTHPRSSFAAIGAGAFEVVNEYTLEAEFDDCSALGKLYQKNAKVLFLGTDFANCTCFHLAEHRVGGLRSLPGGSAMIVDGKRRWVDFAGDDYCDDDFEILGADFASVSKTMKTGKIGRADSKLFSMREAVDFAQNWMDKSR
ncbi:MAG: AAC(3) family N-acetyltransferase [Robiginitomaculum sp.]|nr:MAG: AAC(3) family N-acetyltransferase [Robiginitomaculum sp.]